MRRIAAIEIFVIGPAGTGKTRLINMLKTWLPRISNREFKIETGPYPVKMNPRTTKSLNNSSIEGCLVDICTTTVVGPKWADGTPVHDDAERPA